MEKGTKNLPFSKTNHLDTKKTQDAATNKHLRLPRYKESVSPKPDSHRKANPRKNREFFDKRPRNRTGAVCEKYGSEIMECTDWKPESKHGYKKANLNHLLNFTIAPHEHCEKSRPAFNRHKLPKYNKELFLQANCQFVARENGNYAIHQKNPDILVEWSLIEEIHISYYEEPTCPICLCTPVAAKITRCGHIFCWPCVLHYLALTDKTWQKCPICFEAVHNTDLKSVSVQVCKLFSMQNEITMWLMKREKGSLISVRIDNLDFSQALYGCNEENSVTRYQKLLLASKTEVHAIIDRERKQLNTAFEEEKNTPEVCFIESALKLLEDREKYLKESWNDSKVARDLNANKTERKQLTSISSIDSHEEFCDETPSNQSNINSPIPSASTEEKKGISHFYQSEDGQHIYLHNMNVRMLVKEFGSLEMSPLNITAKIVEIEKVSMTEVLRKKMRYLQHLPLTCEFHIVELDFCHLLSAETIHEFEDEIKKRKQYRNRKARDERRREKMIEWEENKKLGKYPRATYNLNSVDQFPVYNPDDYLSLSPPQSSTFPEDICGINNNSTAPSDCITPTSNPGPSTSFAQMLKNRPGRFSSISNQQKKLQVDKLDDDSDGDHPYLHSLSLNDKIQRALDAYEQQDPKEKIQGSKKKKKGKQLLFTNAMCRNK